MLPILFKCQFFTVYTYGVFVAIAFIVSTVLLTRRARGAGLSEEAVYNLCILLLASGIISARLFYIVLNLDYFAADPFEVFKLQHGGLVWFGGLIGAVICGFIYMRYKKLSFVPMLDLFVPYVALGQAIGRLGCFFNGCCYGREAVWGIFFPVHGRALIPSQLFDSLTLFFIFLFLRFMQKRLTGGRVFLMYLILASAQRFIMEFVRGDERPFYLSLSVFQWISTGLFLTGIFCYLFLSWKKKSV
ncbi:MAG TPA: prolipoprotein diacylglyceryl transferase [Candidatus Omnitrophica bacterium]|nr:prolipoprotein diacylglyceryl transferase [Candidatus Omnitrophota bacterium]